jgi:hypothetical protein
MFQAVRCKLGMHRWGGLQGDTWGAFHKCEWCLKIKRVGDPPPPEAHDRLGLHS